MSVTTERFDIQTRLATGCAGLVYRAVDRQSGMPVALKLLQTSEEFTHPLDVCALLRDAGRLRKISGPHVAQLLDVVPDADGPVLVYQFIDGECVATLPDLRRIEKNEAIDLAAQFLAALECAEKTGSPHGDWKPSNVVIGKSDAGRSFALVLDWGLAAFRPNPPPDSLLFMAPERLLGEPASFRADLFSAAAVLHYLLNGRLLVGGADRLALVESWKVAHPEGLKQTRPDLPSKFVDWLASLMDVRPKKRPASVAEARKELAAFKPPPPPLAPRHLAWRPPATSFQSSASVRSPMVAPMAASQPAAVAARSIPAPIIRVPQAAGSSSWQTPRPGQYGEVAPPAVQAVPPAAKGKGRGLIALVVVVPLLCAISLGAMQFIGKKAPKIASPRATPAVVADAPVAGNDWTDWDIGQPGKKGGSSFDAKSNVWTVTGGGADIWLAKDQFHLAGKKLVGNGEVKARVTAVANTHAWAKSGVMFRESPASDSPFVHIVASAGGSIAFQWRTTRGAQAASVEMPVHIPIWLKLTRESDQCTGWFSHDGAKWTRIGEPRTVRMPPEVMAGLCVNSHNNTVLNTTTFTDFCLAARPSK